jgi:NTE family protein
VLGAVQVGMLHALVARGIVPDLVVGTSVGAINGAWFAGHPTLEGVERLGAIWRSLTPREIFPFDPRTALLGFLGRRDHLVSAAPLERLVRRHLPYRRLEEARVPIHVVATDVVAGTEVVLSTGDAVGAILGSSAIPGVFPPVRHDGRLLMDGGILANTPVARAVALGADAVYVLRTGCHAPGVEAPRTALAAAMLALTVLSEERLLRDVERFSDSVRIELVPPPAMPSSSPLDLRRSGELIEAAEAAASHWLRRRLGRRVALPLRRIA